MIDWNDIDDQAASEGAAISGGYRGVRQQRSTAPPNRKDVSSDYRVKEREQKKVNNLSLLNVIDGRIK